MGWWAVMAAAASRIWARELVLVDDEERDDIVVQSVQLLRTAIAGVRRVIVVMAMSVLCILYDTVTSVYRGHGGTTT
jgi:hypothetical protein